MPRNRAIALAGLAHELEWTLAKDIRDPMRCDHMVQRVVRLVTEMLEETGPAILITKED